MANPMLEAAICPLCGQKWCGNPCLRDPHKSNALLFKKDGSEKTLHERGLAWNDPPLMLTVPVRSKPKDVTSLLKAAKGVTKGVTEKPERAPNKRDDVTNNPAPVTKKGRGRPKGGMSAAERAAAYRKRKATKPQQFEG